jgi:hypothetical protein
MSELVSVHDLFFRALPLWLSVPGSLVFPLQVARLLGYLSLPRLQLPFDFTSALMDAILFAAKRTAHSVDLQAHRHAKQNE